MSNSEVAPFCLGVIDMIRLFLYAYEPSGFQKNCNFSAVCDMMKRVD